MEQSTVRLAGESSGECGYCKSSMTSISYGIVSRNMTVNHYENLMLIGWRRSGTYFYKPVLHKTCCPMYTIRLNTKNFAITKSQRQICRRVERYLETGDIHATPASSDAAETSATAKKRELSIELVTPECTQERYELYKKYQVSVHNDKPDEVTEAGFTRFLVDSPLKLKPGPTSPSGQRIQYGTFHQLYRVDGKLIAVGVIDILPSGLSSVYLFYDPDERQLVLGKFTAIKEIEFCKEHSFDYYYMGFYIHSCVKMRYKAEYKPSELLCPTTLQWYPIEICIPLLDRLKFSPFDRALLSQRQAVEDAFTSISASVPTIEAKSSDSPLDSSNGNPDDSDLPRVSGDNGKVLMTHGDDAPAADLLEGASTSVSDSKDRLPGLEKSAASVQINISKADGASKKSKGSAEGSGEVTKGSTEGVTEGAGKAEPGDPPEEDSDELRESQQGSEEATEPEGVIPMSPLEIAYRAALAAFAPRLPAAEQRDHRVGAVPAAAAAAGAKSSSSSSSTSHSPSSSRKHPAEEKTHSHGEKCSPDLAFKDPDKDTADTEVEAVPADPAVDAAIATLEAIEQAVAVYIPEVTSGDISRVDLDVGAGRLLRIEHLTDRGQEIVEPLLRDWLTVAGPTNARRYIIDFK